MRFIHLLPLLALANAIVIPDKETWDSLAVEEHDRPGDSFLETFPSPEEAWKDIDHAIEKLVHGVKHKFKEAVDVTFNTAVKYGERFESAFAGEAWMDSAEYGVDLVNEPPPDGPPHHRPFPPGKKRPPPHHGPGKKPGKRPHWKHGCHQKSNMTVYELIAKSKYTTKLAKLIGEYPDLVELLNGTTANFTVFAPTDKAFAKIPKHAHKPSKEFLKKLLTYHVSTEFLPAGRLFFSRTIPTALDASAIGKDAPQRISTQIGFRGFTLNFYSKVVAANIFGSNGVIHGIDSILLPPPKVATIISALPGYFSTFELALVKTGLYSELNDTSTHEGGTLFAPSNLAFKKLGPKINAFLFSKYGEKYLKALLLYHASSNITLYSDAIYKAEERLEADHWLERPGPPKSVYHIDLPSELKGKSLSIDVARYGRMITMKINAFINVAVLDGIAADGVMHVVPNVLIPPKTPGMPDIATDEMEIDELIERLSPYVDDHDDEEAQKVIGEIYSSDEKEYPFEIQIEL